MPFGRGWFGCGAGWGRGYGPGRVRGFGLGFGRRLGRGLGRGWLGWYGAYARGWPGRGVAYGYPRHGGAYGPYYGDPYGHSPYWMA